MMSCWRKGRNWGCCSIFWQQWRPRFELVGAALNEEGSSDQGRNSSTSRSLQQRPTQGEGAVQGTELMPLVKINGAPSRNEKKSKAGVSKMMIEARETDDAYEGPWNNTGVEQLHTSEETEQKQGRCCCRK